MSTVLLNSAHLDWLTLTTFEAAYIDVMSSIYPHDDGQAVRRNGYEGMQWGSDEGTVFFGQGEQKGRPHFMMQASGYRAQGAWEAYSEMVRSGPVRVTRVDVALTVLHEREKWTQLGLFSRLQADNGRKVIRYEESLSGPQGEKMATVYVGAPQSRRQVRVYEKVVGDDERVGLRAEVEYKGDRAPAVAAALLGGTSAAAVLRDELERVGDSQLYALYSPYLTDAAVAVRVEQHEGNTERWLRTQVLPALRRVMREHGREADRIRYMFLEVLLETPGEEPTDE